MPMARTIVRNVAGEIIVYSQHEMCAEVIRIWPIFF
jgi:hypothetical protein